MLGWHRYSGAVGGLLLALLANPAQALGLGELKLQSQLGQPLRASVTLLGAQADDVLQVCVKARLLAVDGTFLSALRVLPDHNRGAPTLLLTSHAAVLEPVATILLEVQCEANVSRSYPILLDPAPNLATNPAYTQAPNSAPNSTPSSAPRGPALPQAASDRANASDPATPGTAPEVAAAQETARQKRAARRAAKAAAKLSKRLKAAAELVASASNGPARNVLKIETADLSGAGANTPGSAAGSIKGNSAGNSASNSAASDGAGNLKLLLSRKIAGDASPLANAAEAAFSDTVRQQQNNAVLLEVGRAEVRNLQQQIALLEQELQRMKQGVPAAALARPAPEPRSASTAARSPLQAPPAPGPANSWLIGLALMLFACMLAIIWLLWRLLQLRTRQLGFADSVADSVATRMERPTDWHATEPGLEASSTIPDWGKPGNSPPVGAASAPAAPSVPKPARSAKTWLDRSVFNKPVFSRSVFDKSRAEQPVAGKPVSDQPATRQSSKQSSKHSGKHSGNQSGNQSNNQSNNQSRAGSFAASSGSPAPRSTASATAPGPTTLRFEKAGNAVNLPSMPAPPSELTPHVVNPNQAQSEIEPLIEFDFGDELQSNPEPDLEPLPWDEPASRNLLSGQAGRGSRPVDYATETEIPKVEEFTDVMYEAEFWVSLGKHDNAISILEHYTLSENGHSPMPWLLLFDLYHKTESSDQYGSLQYQFQRIFNAKIPDWNDYEYAVNNIGLEQMGLLMARVETLWGSSEIVPFLESLLIDDRDGTRQGFELGVYRDILFLFDLARELRKTSHDEADGDALALAPL